MEGDLESFVERCRSAVEDDPEMSEGTTDLRIVLPFLRTLGWDVHGGDVLADYAVAGDEGEHAVDYALVVDGVPAAFVVSGRYGRPLPPSDARRLDAAMDAAGVEWGLATNGDTFLFVAEGGDGAGRVECSLPELPERVGVLKHFSRTAAENRHERRRRRERQSVADRLRTRRGDVVTSVESAFDRGGLPEFVARELADATEAFVDGTIDALAAGDHPGTALGRKNSRSSPEDDSGEDSPRENATDRAAGDGTAGGVTENGDGTAPGADAGGSDGTAAPTGSGTARDAGPGSETGGGADAPHDGPAGEATPGTPSGDDTPDASTADAPTADGRATADASASGADDSGGAGVEPESIMNRNPSTTDDSGGSDDGDVDPESIMNRRGEASTDASSDGREYVAKFFSDGASVGAVGHGTSAGALVQAVEYLIEQHSMEGSVDLPWGPSDDRAVLNHDPVHPDGTDMVDAAELSNGYYVCTTIGEDAMQSVVEKLAEKSGLRVMFQGDWS